MRKRWELDLESIIPYMWCDFSDGRTPLVREYTGGDVSLPG